MVLGWLQKLILTAHGTPVDAQITLPPVKIAPPPAARGPATQAQVDAGAKAFRDALDQTSYSSFVSDQQCWETAKLVADAVVAVRT